MKKLIKPVMVYFLKFLARVIAAAFNRTNIGIREVHDVFNKNNFHFLKKNYYLPIPEEADIHYHKESGMAGIDMNDDFQLRFMDEVILKFKNEFNSFPVNRTGEPSQFHLVNGTFMAGDGNAYYSLIRHIKPKTIIEIGSGFSTLLAAHAVGKNIEESPGYECKLVAIEPYPGDFLLNGFKGLSDLKRCKVQEVAMDFFERLSANDILFIDSSHVLRAGGDVWWEYCEILPRLKPGVFVHIHDISLPKPYPQVYYDSYLYWNEQYLLQAFLTGNTRFEVIWAGTYLLNKYPDVVKAAFSPEFELMKDAFPLAEPSSFWMRSK